MAVLKWTARDVLAIMTCGMASIMAWTGAALAEDVGREQATTGAGARAPSASSAAPMSAGGAVKLSWQLVNPFRFFNSPADTALHRAVFQALDERQRKSPVLSAERTLAPRMPDGWAANLSGKPCWDGDRNRFVCPDATPYVFPDAHRVEVWLADLPDAQTVRCTWATAPHRHQGRVRRGQSITERCDRKVVIDVPYPGGAAVSVEIGGRDVAEADIRVDDLLIVGMGDSFASGEGNPDRPVRFSRERAADYITASNKRSGAAALAAARLVGYPARVGGWRQIGDPAFLKENARWLDQACHRSLYSHQLRAALQLAVENPQRAITFIGVACSGAEIPLGVFLRYKGNEWVPNPPEYSQISAIAEAQCGAREAPMQDLPEAYHMGGAIPDLQGGLVLRKCDQEHARKIDLVMLSIGGNDVGFARLVANAVLSDQSNLKRLGGWFGQVHGAEQSLVAIRSLAARYKSLNRALHYLLHVPWEESDRVLLTAYPAMALLDDGRSVCPDGAAGMEVVPELRLSAIKAREGQNVAERLNREMQSAARTHGWTYVDSHRNQFLGRGICAGWSENALSSIDDLRIPKKVGDRWEPFNPGDFLPYAARQRWFRTPNDAFMTGNFHVSTSMVRSVLKFDSLSWFQLLLAATYSGAFHPTAEGHAAMADAVVEKARGVLAKYEQRAAGRPGRRR